jgi:DNA invertase Pin-like site-specific DNA recombinase
VAARGWSLVATYADNGCSGKDMRRPELAAALESLDAGEADVLIVAKLDRLSRSVLDFARITERARARGWSVVALDVDVDTSTPTGGLVANITSSVAQWEREIIAARTSDALQAKKARGARLGRPVTMPAEVRDRIAAERDGGRTLQAIADDLNAEQVPTARGGRWYPSTIAKVVQSLALDVDAARLAEAAAA